MELVVPISSCISGWDSLHDNAQPSASRSHVKNPRFKAARCNQYARNTATNRHDLFHILYVFSVGKRIAIELNF